MTLLNKYASTIHGLCDKHKVNNMYAFGSVLTDNFNAKSDIDFIVDFESIELESYADNYFGLKFSLEDLFKRPVDLIEAKA